VSHWTVIDLQLVFDAQAVLIIRGGIGTGENLKVPALMDSFSHAGQDPGIEVET